MVKTIYDVDSRLKYVKGLPVEYFKYHGEGLPSTYAMIWCMEAASVCRIFTRDDLNEFLFRLPIALNSIEPVERWLLKEKLLNYEFRGKPCVLTMEDVVMHFGIEVTNHYINYRPREKFLENVAHSINLAMLVGTIGDFSVLAPEEDEEGWKRFTGKEHSPEITPELIAKAEFFAKDTLKFVQENIFSERHPLIAVKEKEIEARLERKRNMPVFNIRKIPKKVIRECLEIMFAEDYAKKLLADPELFDKQARPLIYLGWLLANDLMHYVDGGWLEETEGVDLDYSDYELPDGGSNLNITVDEYNLKELEPLLKGK